MKKNNVFLFILSALMLSSALPVSDLLAAKLNHLPPNAVKRNPEPAQISLPDKRPVNHKNKPTNKAIANQQLTLKRRLINYKNNVIEFVKKARSNKTIRRLAISALVVAAGSMIYEISTRPPMGPNSANTGARRHNAIPIADPLPGQQLHLEGIPQLPGFYHMESNTIVPPVNGFCGIHALYNMARIDGLVLGRRPTDQEFVRAQFAAIGHPAILVDRGTTSDKLAQMATQLRLSPIAALCCEDNNIIKGGFAWFDATRVARAHADADKLAQELHRADGPHVAHFLCSIPRHVFAISVVRNADGSRAMYLHDNLNNQPHLVAHMRRHIENIYNRFF